MLYKQTLLSGILLRRYKRFLADVEFEDGSVTTVHCANTGRMTGMSEPGSRVRLSRSANPKRKYALTLEQVRVAENVWVGVNTGLANRLGIEAISTGLVPGFEGHRLERKEPSVDGGRLDLLYTSIAGNETWVEIKSVTLADGAIGRFPDAPSERALKHLHCLVDLVQAGKRAVLLFCVQRADVNAVEPARKVDPQYADALNASRAKGVEVHAFKCVLGRSSIDPLSTVPVR